MTLLFNCRRRTATFYVIIRSWKIQLILIFCCWVTIYFRSLFFRRLVDFRIKHLLRFKSFGRYHRFRIQQLFSIIWEDDNSMKIRLNPFFSWFLEILAGNFSCLHPGKKLYPQGQYDQKWCDSNKSFHGKKRIELLKSLMKTPNQNFLYLCYFYIDHG